MSLTDGEVDVLLEVELLRRPPSGLPGAAAREGVQHTNGRQRRRRRGVGVLRRPLGLELGEDPADKARVEHAYRVAAAVDRKRARRQIEIAHAQVVARIAPARVFGAQLVVLAHLVHDADAGVQTVDRLPYLAEDIAGRRRGDDRSGRVGRVAVSRNREAGLALHQRSLRVDPVAAQPLVAFLQRECVLRIQRAGTESEIHLTAESAHAWPRDHFHAHHAGVVILGGVRIRMKPDLLDLRFRRQTSAAKAVHVDLRAGSGEVRELVGHLVRVVRQRVDFVGGERLREPVVAPLRRALSLDRDRLLHSSDRETNRRLIIAAPHDERQSCRAEALGGDT